MILLAICWIVQANNDCAAYSCKLSTQFFSISTCSYYDNSYYTPIYYLSNCLDINQPYCSFQTGKNSTCTSAPIANNPTKYPGEKCLQSIECNSQLCIDQTCIGSIANLSCNSNYDCNPGLYCYQFQCIPLLTVNATGCTSDYDCNHDSGC